jgi:hypothetical protein
VSSRFAGEKTRLLVRLGLESYIKVELAGLEAVQVGADVGVELPPESLLLFAGGADAGGAAL